MFCAKCGRQMAPDKVRCDECHHYSMNFWLSMFSATVWVATVVIVFAIFDRSMRAQATFVAISGLSLYKSTIFYISIANTVSTFRSLIITFVGAPIFVLALAGSHFPRFRRVLAVFLCAGLLIVSAAAFMVCSDFYSYAEEIGKHTGRMFDRIDEAEGMVATYRASTAENRFREAHPKLGFTCDFELLKPFGGPIGAGSPEGSERKGLLKAGAYTLSLGECSGNPVENYQLAAVPRGSGSKGPLRTFCAEKSGMVYYSKDQKPESCFAARTPAP